MKNIYVGNLSFGIDTQRLEELFSPFGEVKSVGIVKDRETGRSKGFGFVEMAAHEASAAIEALDGKEVEGRPLTVNEARPREVSGTNSGSPYGRSRSGNGPSRRF